MKRFFGGTFQLVSSLGTICVNKNVHHVMQHPSLGSMTEGPTNRSKILMSMPRPGQEPSIYICLSPFEMVDFIHLKMRRMYRHKFTHFCGCLQEHFVLLKFGHELSMDKASIK